MVATKIGPPPLLEEEMNDDVAGGKPSIGLPSRAFCALTVTTGAGSSVSPVFLYSRVKYVPG